MLTTRPPAPDDAPALAALMTPAISQWLGHWPVPFTPPMAEAKIAAALAATARGTALVEVLLHDGAVAGWIDGSFRQGPASGRAGFGYWLGGAYQGRSLLRALAPAWIMRLHAHLRPRTVWAATQPANEGSRRVLAACGLQPVRCTWMDTPARARHEWVEVWERAWPPSTTL